MDNPPGNRKHRPAWPGRLVTALDDARWYAVVAQPHREFWAENNLKNQGFETYLPRRKKTVNHARQLRTVLAPFFPRYLFVRLDLGRDRWRSVNGTLGVSGLVMAGDRPLPVPGGVVEELMALTDGAGLLRFDSALKTGSAVRLLSGPFADQIGSLETIDDQGRVRVLLDIMGCTVPVLSTADHLVPA